MAHTSVISLAGVTLRYESGTQALTDVTLEVKRGQRICVLGANGSGKSTLASVACGLLAPDIGEVTLVGEQVFDARRDQPIDFDAYRRARRSLGLVFQNPDDQIVTTVVDEDVAFGPENLGVPASEIGRRVERELRRVALTPLAKADPTRLSGGQKQRVAIAGALAMEPEVLVFDEPGSLLDVRGRAAIMRVMERLHEAGTTIVHITHFMEEALAADRVVVLDHGTIVLEGTPQDVFLHEDVIARLGLEEPFVAQLAQKLKIPWTCDEDEAVRQIFATYAPSAQLPGMICPPHGKGVRSASEPAPAPREAEGLATTSPVACASHVCYSYGGERPALDDVSLTVSPGSSLALVGHTGSGKSTLLRLICALEVPDAGSVFINGIGTRRKRDRRRLYGTIGYVMQHPERQLFAETVLQDVAFGPLNLGLSPTEVDERCHRALELVGLLGLDDASPFELSGGQQRLCAIAGILAMEPSLLVLDEPTAGLDPRGRRSLWRILDEVRSAGVTLVQVTHSMDDAARADKVVVLNEAHVMFAGRPLEVFSPAHEKSLAAVGLGLPHPLALARRLKREGLEGLGDPLTLDDLVDAICGLRLGRAQANPCTGEGDAHGA